ncbi:hypothetical protein JOB18_023937 [Solea senegalensis]|uniref:Bcl-2-like protein 12 n=1 Tax=Solea senegalensis TaxID=28829 RepID=A0AAV6RLF0_SOLSE|nr:uncharacterized protein bcl2l12 [Solea senegalensis]KAG7505110.1 hypothetical protein JOB18_023937 [Solea senegalensis]
MSASSGLRSSVSSASLLEVKTETHLVLQAFLNRAVTVPTEQRPGRVGGAYLDHNKYSTKPQPKAKDGLHSPTEDASSADEKKSGLRDLIKQLPRRYSTRVSTKDAKGSLERDIKDDVVSPSSTSEDDDKDKKQQKKQKQKKFRKKLSKLFRLKLEKAKEKEAEDPHPPKPTPLPIKFQSPTVGSPSHPPEFYDDVAEKLEKIAQRSTSVNNVRPTAHISPAVSDKEAVIEQLAQVLCMEGDSINTKIQSDPFLRSSFTRLSYASFTQLLDTFSSTQVSQAPPLPPSASPTLQRMAVTMEVSRRIVTATGAVRMQGFAECYMETFAPWVKGHGGWENVELEEFD